MRFILGFSLFIVLLSTSANSKGLDPLECKKWVKIKFKSRGKNYKMDVPKTLFFKKGYCAKPFKRKEKNDKVG